MLDLTYHLRRAGDRQPALVARAMRLVEMRDFLAAWALADVQWHEPDLPPPAAKESTDYLYWAWFGCDTTPNSPEALAALAQGAGLSANDARVCFLRAQQAEMIFPDGSISDTVEAILAGLYVTECVK